MPVIPSKLSSNCIKCLPLFLRGTVVKGFGRGSKQLGVPTANFPAELVDRLPEDLVCGIYYGFAAVDEGPVHRMVMSIGWNPYYKNEKKSMEAHIMHHFDQDFYGSVLRVVVLGYLRAERSFASVDALVSAIKKDIADADMALGRTEFQRYRSHEFFSPEQLDGGSTLVRSA